VLRVVRDRAALRLWLVDPRAPADRHAEEDDADLDGLRAHLEHMEFPTALC
jgi:hypothetical protein